MGGIIAVNEIYNKWAILQCIEPISYHRDPVLRPFGVWWQNCVTKNAKPTSYCVATHCNTFAGVTNKCVLIFTPKYSCTCQEFNVNIHVHVRVRTCQHLYLNIHVHVHVRFISKQFMYMYVLMRRKLCILFICNVTHYISWTNEYYKSLLNKSKTRNIET